MKEIQYQITKLHSHAFIEIVITYILWAPHIICTHESWGHHDYWFLLPLSGSLPQGAPSNCKESANRSRTKSRPCKLRWIRWKFLEICWWITCGYVTLPETNISPTKALLKMFFPVPKVGYVNSLEGIQIIYGFWLPLYDITIDIQSCLR